MARFRPTDDEAPPVNTEEDRQIWETIKRVAPQTWPARAISEAIDAGKNFVTLPQRAMSGEIDPMSDQAIGETFEGASMMFGGGLARSALKKPDLDGGAEFGIFAGPGSKTADLIALRRAQTMDDNGAEADAIRMATGWFKGPDDKWRYEIADNKAKLYGDEDSTGNLGQYLDHDELYAAYPDIYDTILERSSGKGTGWSVRPHEAEPTGKISIAKADVDDAPMEDPLSILLHEIDHQIQAREGFTGGASPKFVLHQIAERANEVAQTDPQRGRELLTLIEAFNQKPAKDKYGVAYNLYRRNLGEASAGATQLRQSLDPFDRLIRDPLEDMRFMANDKPLIVPYKDINEY